MGAPTYCFACGGAPVVRKARCQACLDKRGTKSGRWGDAPSAGRGILACHGCGGKLSDHSVGQPCPALKGARR